MDRVPQNPERVVGTQDRQTVLPGGCRSAPPRIDGVQVVELGNVLTRSGVLLELFRTDWSAVRIAPRQVNWVGLTPDAVTDWHRHTRQTDHLVAVTGIIKLALWDGRPGQTPKYAFEMPWNQLSGGTVTAMRRNGRSGMVDINGALRADILRWNASTRRKTLTRAPQLMELVTREHGNVLILELLDARLDAYEAPALKSSLNRIIDDGHLHIVVNVQHVSFIDSAGLAALISGLKQLSGRGQLRICAAQPAVRTVLQLTRLDRVIPHFDSEDAALENFPS